MLMRIDEFSETFLSEAFLPDFNRENKIWASILPGIGLFWCDKSHGIQNIAFQELVIKYVLHFIVI